MRRSPVHGMGAFATRRIAKGTRIVEYLGERIGHREANRRYAQKTADDNHTFLFVVDRGIVIDAGNYGNDARYINHGCDPNCESTTLDKRIFIEAIRTIQPGEELCYDYQIQRDRDDPPDVDQVYACRCGAKSCRGSMLEAAKRPPETARRALRKSAARKSAPKRAARRAGNRTSRRSG